MATYYPDRTIIDDILDQPKKLIKIDDIQEVHKKPFLDGSGYYILHNDEKIEKRPIPTEQQIIGKIYEYAPYLKGFDLQKHKMVIAGGFISNIANDIQERCKDIDIFVLEDDPISFKIFLTAFINHIASLKNSDMPTSILLSQTDMERKILNKIIIIETQKCFTLNLDLRLKSMVMEKI